MRPSDKDHDILIDKDGVWHFRGEEMTRQDIVQYFYHNLKRDGDGNYLIEIENDRCHVSIEDAPYVIRSVAVNSSVNDGQPCIEVSLTDGSSEELSNDTPLWTGGDNAMYCRVKKGEHVARFSRSAYYQICEYAVYDTGREQYFINVPNRSYLITSINQP